MVTIAPSLPYPTSLSKNKCKFILFINLIEFLSITLILLLAVTDNLFSQFFFKATFTLSWWMLRALFYLGCVLTSGLILLYLFALCSFFIPPTFLTCFIYITSFHLIPSSQCFCQAVLILHLL